MAREVEQGGAERSASVTRQLPGWANTLLLLWCVCAVAFFVADTYYFPDHLRGAWAVRGIFATQFVLASLGLFVILVAFRFQDRPVSRWMWTWLAVICIWLLAYGFDGLAGFLPHGALPTLEQIAPGLVSGVKPLFEFATTIVVAMKFLTDSPTSKRVFARAPVGLVGEPIAISARAKWTALGGCAMLVAAFALLPLWMAWSDGFPFLLLMFGGLAVVALVVPVLALIDTGDEEMRRYRERHGANVTPVGADSGTNVE